MLFNFVCSLRWAVRGFAKNIFLCMVCAVLCGFMIIMIVMSKSNEAALQGVYENIEVRALFMDNSINLGISYLGIDSLTAAHISRSPFVKDHVYSFARSAVTTAETLENGTFQIYATNNLPQTELFRDGHFVTEYGEGFDESIFKTSNQYAVISKKLAELNGFNYGDKINVGLGRLDDGKPAFSMQFTIAGIYYPQEEYSRLNYNTVYAPLDSVSILQASYNYYLDLNDIGASKRLNYVVLNQKIHNKSVGQTTERPAMLSNNRAMLAGAYDITIMDGYGVNFNIEYAPGYDESVFETQNNKIVISKELAALNNLSLGDKISFDFVNMNPYPVSLDFEIVGIASYSEEVDNLFYNRCYIPFQTMVNIERIRNYYVYKPTYDDVEYIIGDLESLDLFKEYAITINPPQGGRFVVLDEAYKGAVNPLKNSLNMIDRLQSALYYIITASIFFLSYIVLRSKLTDIAVMMALGVNKARVCFILFIEALIVCLIGVAIGFFATLTGVYFYYGTIFQPIGAFLLPVAFFLLSFSAGAVLSVISVINIRPIEILAKRE